MVALSQVRVSAPMAASVRACRGVRRGERDPAAAGCELVAADAVEVAQGSGWGEVLVGEVGVADVVCYEGVVDEGLDQGGVDADRYVASDSLFGPVAYGAEAKDVSEDPEAGFDWLELAVVVHDLGCVGLGGCEAGRQHVAAGEALFVCVGVFVVVVEEPAFADLCVEEPPGAAGGEDALGGCACFGGVLQPPGPDAELERPELGFGCGDYLRCAGSVTAGAAVGVDHHRAGSVVECHIGGAAAAVGYVDPGGVVVDGRKGLRGVGVAVQFCGQ